MPVHVSIHDVCPRYDVEIEQALLLCEARGVRPALLVGSKPEEGASLTDSPAFVSRLHELSAAGSEILLHESSNRLDRGLETLAGLGLEVRGFVPRRWLLPPSLVPKLAVHRIPYAEDRFGILDPIRGRRRACFVLNYTTATRSGLATSLALSRAVRLLRGRIPLRITIHPSDLRCPPVLRDTVRLLEWARGQFVERVGDLFEAR
ncbi:MAG TPA: DUF2334 domain-containing protein [Polyangiaceae bacterium]